MEVTCPHCEGTGVVFDPEPMGVELRTQREATGISMARVARSMKLSSSYICDLEKGRRHWSHELVRRYTAALTHA